MQDKGGIRLGFFFLATQVGLLSPYPSPPEEERGARAATANPCASKARAGGCSLSSSGGEGWGEEAVPRFERGVN
jgi:hypothetical protein